MRRVVLVLDLKRVLASAPKDHEKGSAKALLTPWGETLDASEVLKEHPRPQFARERFDVLNGYWDYAIVGAKEARTEWRNAKAPADFDGQILVPFTPKTLLSGVDRQVMPDELLWYRRKFEAPVLAEGERCILHFQAVDWACACYVNGVRVGEHVGGYLPFSFDITEALAAGGSASDEGALGAGMTGEGVAGAGAAGEGVTDEDALVNRQHEITLCVFDPSDSGTQLRGKQKIGGTGIWYEAQAGIWQTVGLEVVPAAHIVATRIEADMHGNLLVSMDVSDAGNQPYSVCVFGEDGEEVVSAYGSSLCAIESEEAAAECEVVGAQDEAATKGGVVDAQADAALATRTFVFSIPDVRVWDVDDPFLYQLKLTYGDDVVCSYCGFRSISMQEDEFGIMRFCINGRAIILKGVLDQGYWSDGLMTAPADEALVFDIEAAKSMGFNMLRKHIKVEAERWYYHCDRLGMLVWQDMVSGGDAYGAWQTSYKPTMLRWSWSHFSDESPRQYAKLAAGDAAYRREWESTCAGTIEHLRNHPSVVGWTLFNEAWGQFEARRITAFARSLDDRPIDAVSGWYDQRCGDFLSVHNYFRNLEVWADHAKPEDVRDAVNRTGKRAFSISEFGGLTYAVPDHCMYEGSYGYAGFESHVQWHAGVRAAITRAEALWGRGMSSYVYTQLSDVEEEVNGLMTCDRRVIKYSAEDDFAPMRPRMESGSESK